MFLLWMNAGRKSSAVPELKETTCTKTWDFGLKTMSDMQMLPQDFDLQRSALPVTLAVSARYHLCCAQHHQRTIRCEERSWVHAQGFSGGPYEQLEAVLHVPVRTTNVLNPKIHHPILPIKRMVETIPNWFKHCIIYWLCKAGSLIFATFY